MSYHLKNRALLVITLLCVASLLSAREMGFFFNFTNLVRYKINDRVDLMIGTYEQDDNVALKPDDSGQQKDYRGISFLQLTLQLPPGVSPVLETGASADPGKPEGWIAMTPGVSYDLAETTNTVNKTYVNPWYYDSVNNQIVIDLSSGKEEDVNKVNYVPNCGKERDTVLASIHLKVDLENPPCGPDEYCSFSVPAAKGFYVTKDDRGEEATAIHLPKSFELALHHHFVMQGEPLTQNGTEDFSDVHGYDGLIQGGNYAFLGSLEWSEEKQDWISITGKNIAVHGIVETDRYGEPVPEEKHIFRIVDKGVDNFELYSVLNANGQSYLKFTVASKNWPALKKNFIMSYVVDPADDPTIVSAEAGDGVEGKPYSITVDISDVDIPNKDGFMIFVDGENYKYYIKIGEKLIPADSIKEKELPTTFTVNALPFDVVANANGSRTQKQKLTVQAVFEKLYSPGKGDFTYSEPAEATFTDVDQAPVELNAPTVTIPAGPYGTDTEVVIDDFIVDGNFSDADGDGINAWYYWTRGGEEFAFATIPSMAKKGETWTPHVRVYTQPYGAAVDFKTYDGEAITIGDSPAVIASQPASLHFVQGQSDQARVVIVISDPDIADGTEVYAADEFSVRQSLDKGVIADQSWNASRQEFSFSYRLTDPSALNEGLTLSVVLSHGGATVSTDPIAVHYELNKPPQWTSGLALAVAENSQASLDLATKVTDPNQSDTLRFSVGTGLPAGILAEVTGSVLKVSAGHEVVTGQEGTKEIGIPVTVTDGFNPPVQGQVTVAVTNVNRLPAWQGNLALSVNENGQGQLDLSKLASDPDAGDQLSFKAGAISHEGVTVSQEGNDLTVAATYDAVKGELDTAEISIPVTVTDSFGGTAESAVSVTVKHVNRPPVALVPSFELTSGVEIAFDSFFEDPDGDALSYVISDLSAGQLVDREGQPVTEGEPVAADRFPLSFVRPDNQAMTATFKVLAEDIWQDRSEAADCTLTLSSQVLLQLTASGLISAEGEYQAQLSMMISEPAKEGYPPNSLIHSLKVVVSLPQGFVPNLDAMEIVHDLNQSFCWMNRSSFDAATGQLTLDVSAEVREGETLPLGNFMPKDEPAQLLTVPLAIGWTPEMVGTYKLKASFSDMTVGQKVDGQFVAVPAGPDAVRLTVSDLEIYSDFLMAGEPLTENGTEDFSDVEGYNPLIQGINFAFAGSGVYNPDTQSWESINGAGIEIHDLVETDAQGVPVPEEKHIFQIVNKGVDYFELRSVPNANGQSYLKFTVAAKTRPEVERSFLMSYVVDPADDPYVLTAEVGPGTEGQPYSIVVNITDIDNDPLDYIKQDGNYDFFIRINGRDFETKRFTNAMPFTLELAEPLPFDLIANGENGQRTATKTMTVQYVSRKLCAPLQGSEMFSPEQTATFTDVDQAPQVEFEIATTMEAGTTADAPQATVTPTMTTDDDGDEIFYKNLWTLNGSDRIVEGLILPASETVKGQIWTFTAEAYTQPYGQPVMSGVVRSRVFNVTDAVQKIVDHTPAIYIQKDDKVTEKSQRVVVKIEDVDLEEGTDAYEVGNFTVSQTQEAGNILNAAFDEGKREFSFVYEIKDPSREITAEDQVGVTVTVTQGEAIVKTESIPVLYVADPAPVITVRTAPELTVKEGATAALTAAVSVADSGTAVTPSGVSKISWSMKLDDGSANGAMSSLPLQETGFAVTQGAASVDSSVKVPIPFEVLDGAKRSASANYILEVRAIDGNGTFSVNSWNVMVQDEDRAPVLQNATLQNSVPAEQILTGTQVIVTAEGAVDPDGDSVLAYGFNGQSSGTNSMDMQTLLKRNLALGDCLDLQVTATSAPAYDTTAVKTSEPKTFAKQVVVKNSAPSGKAVETGLEVFEADKSGTTVNFDLKDMAEFTDIDVVMVNQAFCDTLSYELRPMAATDMGTLTIDSQTGRVSYSPVQYANGEFSFGLLAKDQAGETAEVEVKVCVKPVNNAPSVQAKNIYHVPDDCDGSIRKAVLVVDMGGGIDEKEQTIKDARIVEVLKDELGLKLSPNTVLESDNQSAVRTVSMDYVLPTEAASLLGKETVVKVQVTDLPTDGTDSLPSEPVLLKITLGATPWYPDVETSEFVLMDSANPLVGDGSRAYMVEIWSLDETGRDKALEATIMIDRDRVRASDYLDYTDGLKPGDYRYDVYAWAPESGKADQKTAWTSVAVPGYDEPDMPTVKVETVTGNDSVRSFLIHAPMSSQFRLDIKNLSTGKTVSSTNRFLVKKEDEEAGVIRSEVEVLKTFFAPGDYQVRACGWNPSCSRFVEPEHWVDFDIADSEEKPEPEFPDTESGYCPVDSKPLPVPSPGEVSVDFAWPSVSEEATYTLYIYDIWGRLVTAEPIDCGSENSAKIRLQTTGNVTMFMWRVSGTIPGKGEIWSDSLTFKLIVASEAPMLTDVEWFVPAGADAPQGLLLSFGVFGDISAISYDVMGFDRVTKQWVGVLSDIPLAPLPGETGKGVLKDFEDGALDALQHDCYIYLRPRVNGKLTSDTFEDFNLKSFR